MSKIITEEICLSKEDMEALQLLQDTLADGAGALISCSCGNGKPPTDGGKEK